MAISTGINWRGVIINKNDIDKYISKMEKCYEKGEYKEYYEVLKGGEYYKLFFDVDFEVENNKWIEKYKDEINNENLKWLNNVFNNQDIIILESHGYSENKKVFKISFNYILPNLKYKQGSWMAKYIINNGGKDIKYPDDIIKYNNGKCGIDLSVYKDSNQLIRMIYSVKNGEKRPKKPLLLCDNKNYVLSIINNCIELKNEIAEGVNIINKKENHIVIDNSFVENLLEIISTDNKYYDDYNLWSKIGWILQELINDEPKYTNYYETLYDNFSKKSKKYKDKVNCVEHMRKKNYYNYENLHINTLIYFAMEVDNNKTLKVLKQQKRLELLNNEYVFLSDKLLKSLSGIDNDISEYLIDFVKNDYKCVSVKNCIIYYFNGVRWKQDTDCARLYNWIKNEGANKYLEEEKKIINVLKVMENDNRRKDLENIKDKINNTYKKVRRHGNINLYIQCICNELYDNNFYEKLDVNRYLLGFENGIYDLQHKIFRDGKPDDYISLSVGYDYPEYYNTDNKIELENLFKKIHINDNIRDYNYKMMSWALCGNQEPQICITKTGSGANGKSIEAELIQKTFGDYCYKLEGGYLTNNKNNYNSGDPFTDKLRGRRYVYSIEPMDAEKINAAKLKELTGGDLIQYRLLFSNEIKSFYPQLHLNIYCNKKLDFDGTDKGLQRRIRVMEYQSKFTDVPKTDKEFKKDEKLRDKLDDWKGDFMKILLDKFDINCKFDEPDLIKKWSYQYINDKNDIVQFINDNLEKGDFTKDKSYFITLNDLKDWYKNCGIYDKKKIKELKGYIEDETGEIFEEKKQISGEYYRNVLLNYKRKI